MSRAGSCARLGAVACEPYGRAATVSIPRADDSDSARGLHRATPGPYERAAVLITSNLPFDEWTETFGTERLTGALLDRLTHHVHILEMNGQSFRLNHSRACRHPDNVWSLHVWLSSSSPLP